MQHDESNRDRRDDLDALDALQDVDGGELRPYETLNASGIDAADPSPSGEQVEQGRRADDAPRRASGGSESERSDRSHQAPHEDHVGRADWAVEGSEGGGDPGAPPRRDQSGDSSRRKKKS
jgi:hypothetical protein